jgi:FkbM family methyltransferase
LKFKNRLKKFARPYLERVGVDWLSRPSLGGLDRKLERYLDFDGGFFVEAGANDGWRQSNTYYFERLRGWRGVLVEGIPELYEACRRQRPGSRVYHAALVDDDYREATVRMTYGNLMSVVEGSMKSVEAQQKHLENAVAWQPGTRVYAVEAPARTLGSILAEIPDLPAIDLLSLDVEGYELNVLRGMRIERFTPRYVLVEARFYEEVDAFLKRTHRQVEQLSEQDYLYVVKGEGGARTQ